MFHPGTAAAEAFGVGVFPCPEVIEGDEVGGCAGHESGEAEAQGGVLVAGEGFISGLEGLCVEGVIGGVGIGEGGEED